ncbi:MAG: 16S rRNA (cytosine(1402)-N(4))-methyltransferase RsmH [Candidatus Nanopelagicales bacterium]|jgi:16S rRNA (cytosine1402-N4)-methyltransferase|nr:16S rRNA (cytosine(1402)-N(4))-methyltransferase RsmH [Candidatus Nanopelagicales bacterium]MDP4666902.1 16S rRNA (cytosine(1402)-N(4))-methyltransferase RsmH [Candidatus Nanopelagicales bacterium]MDP4895744.1 16S rRNA (cytosine(1402)-N(4))-methyltransferase RsmH [Candidatus Nanopelagicales bacterium]
MSTFTHVPVLQQRCLDLLAPAIGVENAILVDATLGLGGHAESALTEFPNLRVIGIDRDPEALELSKTRLSRFAPRIEFVLAVYDEISEVLADLNIEQVHGVLFDLGVSSMQLDKDDRGFTYSRNAPLDMRMNGTVGQTAADVVNTYDYANLARILREYGEERFASRVANAIIRERQIKPFTTSDQLVTVVRDAIPAATRRTGGNPAKRTFQALRIEVNDELAVLERAIPAALDCLALDGRIVVLSYQSLEDRIVKKALRVGTMSTTPVDMPFVPDSDKPWLKVLTRGSEPASDSEIAQNSRATSVRLRAAQRIGVAA